MRKACKYINENLSIKTDKLGKEVLLNVAKTSMSSKYVSIDPDFYSNLVVEAVTSVKTTSESGKIIYPIKSINVLKAHGKGTKESKLIKVNHMYKIKYVTNLENKIQGYAILQTRAAQGMVRRIDNAKIACLDMNLQKHRLQLGINIVVTDPAELEKLRERESDIIKERIQKILASGVNVVLTTKGIDDMCLKYFVEAGAIAVRRVPKDDLRYNCKCYLNNK